MDIQIRKTTADDAEQWAQLRQELWPECPLERHRLETEQWKQSAGLVALAWDKDHAIGFAEASIRNEHVEGTSSAPVPYLEGWYVKLQYRGTGIGRALVRYVEEWAIARGYKELASDAELENGLGIRLHGVLGFREVGRSVHFVKRLV